ncbi:hypothetical protein KFK09_004879 [Dendrobium nobile]|uniref:DCL protein n=1 Tax=Dendrobium nobile TaxID=94219 RepID=A0A8T3BU64_DENNO|nr:hypothetical protein KFK09_004879 [Dendrobium nobile]
MASAGTLLRLRGFLFLQARALRAAVPRRCSVDISSLQSPQHPEYAVAVLGVTAPRATVGGGGLRGLSPPSLPKQKENSCEYHPDYRRWKDKEGEILLDIDLIKFRTKDILHSDRYRDGERLSVEDEKVVVEKLLAYHPHSEDKIGCGLNSIMVDRHPQFRNSRCLFVVRTDGVWIDFSYQKCLRAYIKEKYPSHAERFIKEHFKRI